MSGSFVERLISITFSIGRGDNGQDGADTYTYSGLRISANIVEPGGFAPPTAQITVFGLPPDIMNKLSSLGLYYVRQRNNTVTVSAGDAVNGMSTVFEGVIFEAYVDANGAPDVAFQVLSLDGQIEALKPIPPTSYPGSVPVSTILAGLAKQMDYSFENNGVVTVLSNPYFGGTARDQANAAAEAANINILMRQHVMAIWPKDGSRSFPVPLISPATGMIGYPSFASNGLALRNIFNPAVIAGNTVQVQSSLKAACGNWTIFTLSHTLESNTPDGLWESQSYAQPVVANGG